MRRFATVAAIDWSGAAVARPRGIAVATADAGDAAPVLLRPGDWSRGDVLAWLLRHADARSDLLIGVDFSPGLPFADAGAYFPGWADSPPDARGLWRLVDALSAGSPHLAATGFLAQAEPTRHFRHQHGAGDRFGGGRGRWRVCEARLAMAGLAPSSCLNLVGAAQVGKSSLTGMRVLHRLGGRVPVWPFDPVPATGPLIVEIYTTVAARAARLPAGRSKLRDRPALDRALAELGSAPAAPIASLNDHATDALVTAAWLRRAATEQAEWTPTALTAAIARTEGWTFGA